MHEPGRAVSVDGRVYLTGAATAVLDGWRETTIDVDIKLVPDSAGDSSTEGGTERQRRAGGTIGR